MSEEEEIRKQDSNHCYRQKESLSPLLGSLITSLRIIYFGGHFTGLMLVTRLGGLDSSIW